MNKGHKGHDKGQMSDREAMSLALEALEHWMRIDTVEDMHIFETVTAPEAIAVLRQALEQPEQVNVPEGWKLVPIEPTDAMLSVPVNIDLRECVTPGGVTGLDAVGLFRAWEAMIEAAPQPWDTTDMAHRAGGLSMEQDEIVPSDYSGVTGDYMEQEPVAWRTFDGEGNYEFRDYEMNEAYQEEWSKRNPKHQGWVEPLYAAPPRNSWFKLTDAEVWDEWVRAVDESNRSNRELSFRFARAIEAKLKGKNT